MKLFDPTAVPRELAILLMAPPGSGKTTFSLMWPKVWIANIDNNLGGPLRKLKEQGMLPEFKVSNIFEDDDGNRLPQQKWFDRLNSETDLAIADPDIETIVVDGLTFFSKSLECWTLSGQGLDPETGLMEQKYWRAFTAAMYRYVVKCRNSGKTFIMCAHTRNAYDRDGNTIVKTEPVIAGGTREILGGMFTDVWTISLERLSSAHPYFLQLRVVRDVIIALKNSLLLEEFNKVTPELILDLIERSKKI